MSKTLNFTNVNHDKFAFTTFKQHIFMKYDNLNDLYIQSPWINLYSYGIPKNDKYHKTSESRYYIKIPIDNASCNSDQFGELFQHIDNLLSGVEFKRDYLGSKYEKYELSPCYKKSVNTKYADSVKFKFDKEASEEQALTTEVCKSRCKLERNHILHEMQLYQRRWTKLNSYTTCLS